MSRGREDAKALGPEAPDAEAVADYLRRHPDFLVERPELIAALTPPEMRRGEGVVDMQRFMLDALRAEVAALKAREDKLLAAAEHALGGQVRVQGAVLALLAARSFEHLIRIVNDELPPLLGVDAIALCVENGDAQRGDRFRAGVTLVRPGTIKRMMGRDAQVALSDGAPDDRAVFGAASRRVRSHALLRLAIGLEAPAALLALASRDANGFHPEHGTELLSFFGRVVEHCIRRWLAEPG